MRTNTSWDRFNIDSDRRRSDHIAVCQSPSNPGDYLDMATVVFPISLGAVKLGAVRRNEVYIDKGHGRRPWLIRPGTGLAPARPRDLYQDVCRNPLGTVLKTHRRFLLNKTTKWKKITWGWLACCFFFLRAEKENTFFLCMQYIRK